MASQIMIAFQLAACIYILVRGAFTLNRMSADTAHAIRYAYIVLTSGAAYGLLTAVSQPSLSATLIAAGVSLYMHGEKRNVLS